MEISRICQRKLNHIELTMNKMLKLRWQLGNIPIIKSLQKDKVSPNKKVKKKNNILAILQRFIREINTFIKDNKIQCTNTKRDTTMLVTILKYN